MTYVKRKIINHPTHINLNLHTAHANSVQRLGSIETSDNAGNSIIQGFQMFVPAVFLAIASSLVMRL